MRGKFLFVGEEKFWVRGVTYGTFRPDENGTNYPSPDVVERDFTAIRNAGLNSVRVYTVPPRWLLDLAAARGLRLMIGLPWEQHVAFLDDKARVRDIIIECGTMSDNVQAIRRYFVMSSETKSQPLSSVGTASAGSKISSLSFVGL